jgi:hypothetical protein
MAAWRDDMSVARPAGKIGRARNRDVAVQVPEPRFLINLTVEHTFSIMDDE